MYSVVLQEKKEKVVFLLLVYIVTVQIVMKVNTWMESWVRMDTRGLARNPLTVPLLQEQMKLIMEIFSTRILMMILYLLTSKCLICLYVFKTKSFIFNYWDIYTIYVDCCEINTLFVWVLVKGRNTTIWEDFLASAHKFYFFNNNDHFM